MEIKDSFSVVLVHLQEYARFAFENPAIHTVSLFQGKTHEEHFQPLQPNYRHTHHIHVHQQDRHNTPSLFRIYQSVKRLSPEVQLHLSIYD